MNKIFPFILAFVLIATASHAQAQTTTSTSWKGVPYRVSGAMLKGDANGDGLINMSDVTLVINYILGRNIDDFSFDNAEVTGDGFINMSDVTAIIDIILGRIEEKKPQAYLTCPDDNHPHIIDLGLPSGTKWACCNVGAAAPEKNGGHFAWGAIEETDEPYQPSEEGEDGLGESICGTEHDVAHVKWGGAWQMPSVEQIRELLNNYSSVTHEIIRNEDENVDDEFRVFTYPNGGRIILPHAEEEWEPEIPMTMGKFYWSGTACSNGEVSEYWDDDDMGEEKCAWSLCIEEDLIVPIGPYEYYPFVYPLTLDALAFVRPIFNGESYGYLTLSRNVVSIGVGDSDEVNILSGTGNYRFTNTSSNIAEVTLSGSTITIKGRSEGTTTVTVTDNSSGMSLDISVKVQNICPDSNHPHMIDLGLPSGTKWACCNVGADKPEAKGNKYEWGETGESTDSLSYDYSESIYEDIGEDGDISGTKYDVAHVKWGDSWCMPSCYLANELISHCTYEVITRNGEKGMTITGPTGKTIFLPYADFIYNYDVETRRENCGVYWLSGGGGWYSLYCSSEDEIRITDDSGPCFVRPIIEGHNLSLSKSEMDLYYGESDKVAIYAGGGDYTISCSDTTIVEVSLKGSEIILFGKAPGTATVTVTDVSSGMTADIAVTVRYKDLKLNRNKVSMYYGGTTNVSITSGNGSYTVSNTSPDVIDVSLEGSTITIKAKTIGKAIVTVTDTHTGMTADIIVTVSYRDLLLSANEITTYCGETPQVSITSGNGSYTVSNTSPDVIDVSLSGSTITIKAKTIGEAIVTVTDRTSGMTADIIVTVSYRDLILSANEVASYYGETTQVSITSGNGSYTVSNTSPSVIDVSLEGSTITIKAKATGKATVTVTDMSTGTTADIIVTVSYRNLLLNANEVSIFSGETSEVTITSGNGTYSASCSDPSIVEVTVDGSTVSLFGKELGTTNVTVYDDISGQTTKISVTVSTIILCPDNNHPHLIDLGLPSGTKWACCNVGATSPEATGGYYAWGETEEKDVYSWATYIHCDGTSNTCHDLGENISGTEYDVAHVKWGDAYQMPTSTQIEELLRNCKFKELTYEGVKGKLAISSNGGRLFIPYAGSRKDQSIAGLGDTGQYFSGSKYVRYHSHILLVNPNEVKMSYLQRSYGLTVRPVSK